jgi:hypothetical protein
VDVVHETSYARRGNTLEPIGWLDLGGSENCGHGGRPGTWKVAVMVSVPRPGRIVVDHGERTGTWAMAASTSRPAACEHQP